MQRVWTGNGALIPRAVSAARIDGGTPRSAKPGLAGMEDGWSAGLTSVADGAEVFMSSDESTAEAPPGPSTVVAPPQGAGDASAQGRQRRPSRGVRRPRR